MTKVPLGTASWVRMPSASNPASRKKAKAVTMYMIPIFLWSAVVSHPSNPEGRGPGTIWVSGRSEALGAWRRPRRRGSCATAGRGARGRGQG